VAIEGFYTCEDLAVVSARDQDLCAGANGGLKNREGTGGKLMLFDLRNFVLSKQESV
jgi:hypothetical protein